MVRIYTDRELLQNRRIIESNDKFFLVNIAPWTIDDLGRQCMLSVDGAAFVEPGKARITTPFGETDIWHLSAGSKALINLVHIVGKGWSHVLNVTGCGSNSLNFIFKFIDGKDADILLRHYEVQDCDDFSFMLNGSEFVQSTQALHDRLKKEDWNDF
jgi:hypothetical protein